MQSTIESRLADANLALSSKFTEVAASYIDLLLKGGSLSILGQDVNILGLQRARTILLAVAGVAAPGDPQRQALQPVIEFATLAIDNLGFSRPRAHRDLRADQRADAHRQRPKTPLDVVRRRGRRDRLAHVRDDPARRRPARARARGARLHAARPRARVAHWPAGGEDRARGAVRVRGRAADAARHIAVRAPGLRPLPAVARRAGGGRARVRGAGRRDRRPGARGARRLAARDHAVAADRVPGTRPVAARSRRASTTSSA